MYQLQNLKDIHNLRLAAVPQVMLYRNVSIAKFEGYTQQIGYKISKILYFKERNAKTTPQSYSISRTCASLFSKSLRKMQIIFADADYLLYLCTVNI